VRPQGFPPALRIRRGKDFDLAFREGSRAGDDLLLVVVRPNGGPHPRLGLAVSRGVGGAVVRNRVKRLLRESFRTGRERLPAAHDLVVVPREGTDPARWTLEAVQASLLALAVRAAERPARGAGDRGKRRKPPAAGEGPAR
jgi:ribonuclease P protein component